MIRFLIQRPIAVTVSFFAFLLMGLTSYFNLPVSLLPNVPVPEIIVRLDTRPLPAREAEVQMVEPLRQQLIQLSGLSDLESVVSDDYGSIHLRFEHGTNMSMAFVETNEKVDFTMNSLPRGMPRPTVSRLDVSDIPIFRLEIYQKSENRNPDSFAELSTFVREVVRRRLEQLPQVAMIDITGAAFPEIALKPKENVMRALGFEPQILQHVIKDNEVDVRQVLVQDGYYRYPLKITGGWIDIDAIKAYPVRAQDRLFTLADIAEVRADLSSPSGVYFNKTSQAITASIIKQSATRMNDFQQSVGGVIEELRKSYPNLAFEVSQDQTALLDFAMNNLKQDLLVGGLLAFVCMWIFVRKPQMAWLIGLTIPISLLLSLLGFYMLGISLNIISLGGLILGLSMTIDNSIVVMDSINRKRIFGGSAEEAVTRGTLEVIRPLITSVLTNCSVFVPLIFLSGFAGALFFDQAMSIVLGVVSSLIVAIFLIPPLYHLFCRYLVRVTEVNTSTSLLIKLYDRGLLWSFKHPGSIMLMVLLLSGSGIFWYASLEKSRLPDLTRKDLEIRIAWNESITLEENQHRMLKLAARFSTNAKVWNSWVGTQQYQLDLYPQQGVQESLIYANFSEATLVNQCREELGAWLRLEYPRALVEFEHAKNAMELVFGQQSPDLELQLTAVNQPVAPKIEDLEPFVSSLNEMLPDAKIAPLYLEEEIVLSIDAKNSLRYGFTPTEVSDALENTFKEKSIGHLYGQEVSTAFVQKPKQFDTIEEALQATFLRSDEGTYALGTFLSSFRRQDYRSIHAGPQGAYYPVKIETSTPKQDMAKINHLLRENNQIQGVISGGYFEYQDLIKEMSFILIVSVLLLYFILAAQFESLVQPLFILLELPIAISGSLLFLYLGGSTVNIMSMIGVIVMSGLVINDSILKLDAINHLRVKGLTLKQAIFEGGHKRVNSIFMITITSIGALVPTLFMDDMGSEMQKPLVLALLGGMSVGLLVSLFFIPIVYLAVYKRHENLEEI